MGFGFKGRFVSNAAGKAFRLEGRIAENDSHPKDSKTF